METIVVKIGTESLRDFDSNLKVEKMVEAIATLMSQQIRIILVSSGAVGEGIKVHPASESKPLLASIGQPILFEKYRQKFAKLHISAAQFLPAHAQIEDDSGYRQMAYDTISSALEAGIIPIVNENDAFSPYEMNALRRGADNDNNALIMAQLFRAKSIILITNTNGVYSDVTDSASRIPIIKSQSLTDEYVLSLCGAKSEKGTGGMNSKLLVGRVASQKNIVTHICDGVTSGVIEHVQSSYKGENGGTVIM
ncbi:hypothetical protein KBB89_01295 [Candidatus Gracilibacteria bacterium]|nr:hypothetical protein [Candidatus Gracilibacteria bacterium]